MASMATAQPLTSGPFVSIGPRRRRMAWLLWIGVSVVGSVAGALAAWQARSLYEVGPAFRHLDMGYIATVINALIFSGGQWFVLQRYRLDAYWWVPATVAADLLTAIIVIPTILNLFVPPSGTVITFATQPSDALVQQRILPAVQVRATNLAGDPASNRMIQLALNPAGPAVVRGTLTAVRTINPRKTQYRTLL